MLSKSIFVETDSQMIPMKQFQDFTESKQTKCRSKCKYSVIKSKQNSV